MMKNNRILVIDDDPEIRDLMYRILSAVQTSPSKLKVPSFFDGLEIPDESVNKRANNKCYELTMVESGEEGIEAVKESLKNKTPYSLAFVDMMMGGLNGAETAGWMWQIDPNIKIVIVTGFGQYLSEDYIMVTGRKDLFYLRKPFNPEEVRQFARVLTEQWNLEIEKEKLTNELKLAKEKLEKMNNNL